MVNQSPRNHFTNQNFIHFIKGTKTQTGSEIRQEGKSSNPWERNMYVCLTKRSLSPQGAYSPMNPRTLNTQGDAQVDAGPPWVCQTTVTTAGIPRYTLDSLQCTFSF